MISLDGHGIRGRRWCPGREIFEIVDELMAGLEGDMSEFEKKKLHKLLNVFDGLKLTAMLRTN